MGTVTQAAWEWRKSHPITGWLLEPIGAFHAYDVNNNAACDPRMGLYASIEEPNEGSQLCAVCMEFVKANPAGREPRQSGQIGAGE